jgi:hypothetical protein
MPDMTQVFSRALLSVGYDEDAQELYVELKGGRTYIYSDVPQDVFQELMDAGSKGSYFAREIKPNYDAMST